MATRARERLLETAEQLFYAEGIHAVGVERLLNVSGVGRASFYRHFPSKDALVVAVLETRDRRWRTELAAAVAQHDNAPLAVFDVMAERYIEDDFRGCAFINAMVEAADRHSAVHRIAHDHKRALRDYLARLIADAGYADHTEIAVQFLLLMDGAIVTALREVSPEPAYQARRIAALLLAER